MKILLAPNHTAGEYWSNQGLLIGIKFDRIITEERLLRSVENGSTFHLFGDRHNFFANQPSALEYWNNLMDACGYVCVSRFCTMFQHTFDEIKVK